MYAVAVMLNTPTPKFSIYTTLVYRELYTENNIECSWTEIGSVGELERARTEDEGQLVAKADE